MYRAAYAQRVGPTRSCDCILSDLHRVAAKSIPQGIMSASHLRSSAAARRGHIVLSWSDDRRAKTRPLLAWICCKPLHEPL